MREEIGCLAVSSLFPLWFRTRFAKYRSVGDLPLLPFLTEQIIHSFGKCMKSIHDFMLVRMWEWGYRVCSIC